MIMMKITITTMIIMRRRRRKEEKENHNFCSIIRHERYPHTAAHKHFSGYENALYSPTYRHRCTFIFRHVYRSTHVYIIQLYIYTYKDISISIPVLTCPSIHTCAPTRKNTWAFRHTHKLHTFIYEHTYTYS